MAVASRGRAELAKQWRNPREGSPERAKVWAADPRPMKNSQTKVPVVYYLCRNGQLEHPHFMEVALSRSSDGLYLKDVINRLDLLRGKGLASLYSWSSKRSYKNGYVWHDLTEEDFIYPAHGNEYVLKGTELLHAAPAGPETRDASASSSSSSERPPLEIPKLPPQDNSHSGRARRKKSSPWGSFDLGEYRVYKAAEAMALAAAKASDAATQTDDREGRPPRRQDLGGCDEERAAVSAAEGTGSPTTELGSYEISPPASSSSPETLEALIKAEVQAHPAAAAAQLQDGDRTVGRLESGRMRASAVLMQLISCGSISVEDHALTAEAAQDGEMLPRGRSDLGRRGVESHEALGFSAMDREYFSGSIVETKKTEGDGSAAALPGLQRSSSYNADRSSKREMGVEEMEGFHGKCIPMMARNTARRSEASGPISRSNLGSRRFADEDGPRNSSRLTS